MRTHVGRARCVLAALIVVGALVAAKPAAAAPLLTEGFDNIGTLSGAGWSLINNSTPGGVTNWFQGNPGVFSAFNGAPNSYIASNYLAAGAGGDISNWLILPTLSLDSGDQLTFWAQAGGSFLDQIEVRFSANGGSANVGGTPTSVGDFTTLLLPTTTVLGGGWAKFTVSLSGLAGPTSGRLAIRYVVSNTDVNGEYVGIDALAVNAVPEPATLTLLGLGLTGLAAQRRRRTAAATRAHAQKGA